MSAPTAIHFLCEVNCRHGCLRTQISDQGREFTKELSDHLHQITEVEQ